MPRAFIGLGTNMGDRRANLERAAFLVSRMGGVSILAGSSILETEPVDYLDQPAFLNRMLMVETVLDPHELLEALLNVENEMGRKRLVDKGPRIIDLDIILYDDLVISDERLTVPHPRRLERPFIVRHLAELDPLLKDPVTGISYIGY
jgi:2-amino-4-hydroxy-6-hydroxymethyldihydropteridine diphosphokinase